MTDPILRLIERLPRAEPDAARAARVRARCRQALDRRKSSREVQQARSFGFREYAISGLCLAYLTAVIRETLRLYGIG